MKKIDFKKEYKKLFRQSDKKISYIVSPKLNYLTIEGKGHPEKNTGFEQKIGALYGVAYTLKFMFKNPDFQPPEYFDFVIPPMETFWYMNNCDGFDVNRPNDWRWTLLLMQAGYITPQHIEHAKNELIKKGKTNDFTEDLQLKKIKKEKAVQLLHIGPYNQVSETVEKLMKELESKGLEPYGKYREIYLNDSRRVPPEKLKTICRLPFRGSL
ncbi:GyrI-like domain-containing protein [Maribellus maritimus]|uniref:GyrI-like domain-containing protein n=1 Tax=Maribellus maritimus TaxID=2870838 RepID=UPI001EEB7A30|nr:GyrI-like domain-containing protein [Maribellus maritimus]MCG6189643.1 GyrI-like domain-containing protein [Maribellus maritimus]